MKRNKTFIILGLLSFIPFLLNFNDNPKILERNQIINVVLEEDNKQDFFNELRNTLNFNYRVQNEFNGLINGYSIKVNEQYLSKIQNFKSVLAASKEHYYRESSYYEENSSIEGEDYLKDINLPTKSSKMGEGVLIAVLDSGFDINHESFIPLDSIIETKIDEDYVDSLKDSSTFFAKNGKYINNKIPFVYDYGGTGSLEDISNKTPINPDDNVIGVTTHGMHVASIACANGEKYSGVARNSQLAFMKVFTDAYDLSTGQFTSYCSSSKVILALNDAYEIGADIINCSFGDTLNEQDDIDYATCYALSSLESSGVIVSASVGNDGKGLLEDYGNNRFYSNETVEQSYLGSFAAVNGIATVAAIDSNPNKYIYQVNNKVLYGKDLFDKENGFMRMIGDVLDNDDIKEIPYEIILNDANEKDYDGLDVKNKIVVINESSSLNTEVQSSIAFKKGALGILLISKDFKNKIVSKNYSNYSLSPIYMISYDDGSILKNENNKTLTISKNKIFDASTNGTKGDLSFAPTISCPGVNIKGAISTVFETNKNKYGTMSGTSMAAPIYSGSAAIILSDRPTSIKQKDYLKTLYNRTLTTASIMRIGNNIPVSVRRQGAGIVNIDNAEKGLYLSYKNKGYIELKNNDEIKDGKLSFDIIINNENKATGQYNLNIDVTVPQITSTAYDDSLKGKKFQGLEQQLITTFKGKVNLTGEEKQTLKINFSLNEEDKNKILNDFPNGIQIEGFVSLSGNYLPTISIPYLGFLGDYKTASCVEEFDFEKDVNKTYESEILNTHENYINTYLGSLIIGSKGKKENFNLPNIYNNSINPYNEFNVLKGEKCDDGLYHIACGLKNRSSTICILQYVTRTVRSNTVTITNSKGENVFVDHLLNTNNSNKKDYSLNKSLLYEGKLDRAYLIIDLNNFKEGNYLMNMEYTLMDGTKQNLKYGLFVIHEARYTTPTIDLENLNNLIIYTDSLSFAVNLNDKNKLAIYFYYLLFSIKLNGEETSYEVVNNKFTYKLDLSTLNKDTKNYIEVESINGEKIFGLFSNDLSCICWSKELNIEDEIIVNKTINSEIENSYDVNILIKNNDGSIKEFNEDVYYYYFLDKEYSEIEVLDNNDEVIEPYSLSSYSIGLKNRANFKYTYSDNKVNNLYYLIIISMILISFSSILFAILLFIIFMMSK